MPARLVQRFACRFLFEGPVDWHGSSSTTCRARSGARASRPRSARRQSGGAAVPVRARRVKTLGNCRAACAAATPPDAAVSPANHPSMRACRRLPLQLSASDAWAWASPRGCTTTPAQRGSGQPSPPSLVHVSTVADTEGFLTSILVPCRWNRIALPETLPRHRPAAMADWFLSSAVCLPGDLQRRRDCAEGRSIATFCWRSHVAGCLWDFQLRPYRLMKGIDSSDSSLQSKSCRVSVRWSIIIVQTWLTDLQCVRFCRTPVPSQTHGPR